MNQRTRRFFELARKAAQDSDYRTKHGAVLTHGPRVMNTAHNSNSYCAFGTRFRDEPGYATLHAELGVILGIDRNITEGATVYVVRIDTDGEFAMSEPCSMCRAALEHVGIRKVFYTTGKESYGSYKI